MNTMMNSMTKKELPAGPGRPFGPGNPSRPFMPGKPCEPGAPGNPDRK